MGTHATKAKAMRLLVLALSIAMMSTLAQAGALYSTGFESSEGFSQGDINGQNGWMAGADRGGIVADGDNWVLDLPMSADSQGGSVSRTNTKATQRYLVIELDFKIVDDGGSVLASLGWETDLGAGGAANTNSKLGTDLMSSEAGKWRHFGMEVDQTTGLVTAVKHNGVWIAEDDVVSVSGALDRLVFQGSSEGGGGHLYIDNLSVRESDTRVSVVPEPAGVVALATGLLGLVGLLSRRGSV